MTIRVSGKGISVSEALRERISDRTDDVLRKYFDGNFSGHVTIGKDKAGFRTDCMLHLDSGTTLEADSTATDAYASADQALIQIEKRLRRYKSRLKDRSARKSHAENAAHRHPRCAKLRDRGAAGRRRRGDRKLQSGDHCGGNEVAAAACRSARR